MMHAIPKVTHAVTNHNSLFQAKPKDSQQNVWCKRIAFMVGRLGAVSGPLDQWTRDAWTLDHILSQLFQWQR